jgi:carboxynorspermidine decarboxylase
LEKRFKSGIKTPAYVIDEGILLGNLNLLRNISIEADCKILLAQKAFSSYSLYPLIGDYLAGAASSGVYEAELAYEKMSGRENHIYSPAYNHDDFMHILKICDHIVFNNFDQLAEFTPELKKSVKKREIGIRINPEFSEASPDIYNPCGSFSRLGCRICDFPETLPETVTGLHFHTMCEQGADALEATLKVVEEKFGKYLNAVRWVNFGGGQLITSDGYDVPKLIRLIKEFKQKYDVNVYLEPGEAVAKNAGFLVCRVLDIMNAAAGAVAILDASAACHMPDVLEMPYRPEVDGADLPGKLPYTYMLAGNTCLAGDVMGQYSFSDPLKKGDEIVFCDMAIYTIVKNNMFNGMKLPSIVFRSTDDELVTARKFNYRDFLSRL